MYDYRKLSQSEKITAVEQRRQRGYPLHKPPHGDLGPGWYMLTAATFEHRRHFSQPAELTALTRHLLDGLDCLSADIGAWVVLPNHYHILAKVEELRSIGAVLGSVHGRSSRYANKRDSVVGRQVWYKYSDRKIRSERHFWTAVHYILWNPVKHGYVSDPKTWPWSSYDESAREHEANWFLELQREYPLLSMGKQWDD